MSGPRLEGTRAEQRDVDAVDTAAPHPAVLQVLRYFEYGHLPEHLQDISSLFHTLAWEMVNKLPHNPEVTVGLRKLLEAKDCFVRARLS